MSCSPAVCRLDVFPPRARLRHAGLIEQLRASLAEVRELPDGYALRFADDGTLFDRLAEWVRLESVCCPFLNFELRIEHQGGPVWLRLTGPEGTKRFLRNEYPISSAAAR
jgi:hypothetical protein